MALMDVKRETERERLLKSPHKSVRNWAIDWKISVETCSTD